MKIERELMRGAGPLAVLKLLEKEEMYGYELVEQLAARTEGVLAMGQSTLYPMLYNLEAQGFIRASWRDAPAGAGGTRERKYYALTPRGKKRLAQDQRQYASLMLALTKLGALAPDVGGAA